jgi:predicted nucleotidyltransferase
MASDEQPFSDLEATLKKSAAALREAQVPFLLGGSLASWARGGPETRHDLDLMIKECDVDRALEALEQVGMRSERPPEDWLVKAWDGDVLVDLIHHPKGMPVDDDVIARGEEMSVLSMDVRVMSLEDVLVTKLNSLTEHHLRYETLLAIARALREQIDWDHVRERTAASPFARAFFVMLEGLAVIAPSSSNGSKAPSGVDVRVVTPGHEAGTGRFRQPEDGPAAGSAGADDG